MAVREETGASSESSLVAAARVGDHRSFEALVEPLRRELHLHCYRLMGSLTDADDMLQESLLKAWRRIDTVEGRAPFRAWLYKIATNACLNELATRGRRGLLGARDSVGSQPPPEAEVEHLQPYPDRLLDDEGDPAARFDKKESVALAFIAAIQLLPPRQRAVVILRDVLGWSAREVADSLDCSVASANSALQRARHALRTRFKTGVPDTSVVSVSDISERRTLARFMDAWERADFDALASLLREDAVMTMPPEPVWFRGRAAVVDFFSTVPAAGRLEEIRLVSVGANRQPALAAFIAEPADGGQQFYGLMVFAIQEDGIAAITGFPDPGLSDYFGLPSWLPPDHEH